MKPLKQTLFLGALLFMLMFTAAVPIASTASAVDQNSGRIVAANKKKKDDKGVKCAVLPDSICSKAGTTTNGHSAIWYFLVLILNILTAGVGVAAVIGVIIAAIMYSSAGDSSEQVHKAKMMIFNIVLGLVAYLGMYALLQFLIPGGVFS